MNQVDDEQAAPLERPVHHQLKIAVQLFSNKLGQVVKFVVQSDPIFNTIQSKIAAATDNQSADQDSNLYQIWLYQIGLLKRLS